MATFTGIRCLADESVWPKYLPHTAGVTFTPPLRTELLDAAPRSPCLGWDSGGLDTLVLVEGSHVRNCHSPHTQRQQEVRHPSVGQGLPYQGRNHKESDCLASQAAVHRPQERLCLRFPSHQHGTWSGLHLGQRHTPRPRET